MQEDFDEPLDVDEERAAAVEKAPVEMTADDLADEEWAPSQDKGKKGKKGKGKKGKAQNEEEELARGSISVLSLELEPITVRRRTYLHNSLCPSATKYRTSRNRRQ